MLCSLGLSASSQALTIIINRQATFTNDSAFDAFVRAANTWSGAFTDDITVNIDADFTSLDPGVLGSTNAQFVSGGYDVIVDQLRSNADADDSIHNFIPTLSQFTAATAASDSLTTNVVATKANLKAVGFGGLDGLFGSSDGSISFNSDFSFDFDNSNGVSSGAFDFESIALHEIGHLLGFTSVVDQFDLSGGQHSVHLFDVFRLGSNDPALTGNAFTSAERQLTPGEVSYFSDGESQILLSTGVTDGDGRQASHFKDNLGLGALDPTLAPGETAVLTENDLAVFDAIGYDRVRVAVSAVPEPQSWSLLALAASVGIARRKRRRC